MAQDCEWDPPEGACVDPCGTQLVTDEYYDTSCATSCCEAGVCFIIDRNDGGSPCEFNCYNTNYAQCRLFGNCDPLD
jgi:hypothetical protein